MPTSLYIQLDFFHIGAYRAAGDAFHAEAYAHDNDYYYLVLQPFLIANSEKASSPGISEYFKTWSGATLAEPGRVVAIDETLVNALNTEGKFAATPVPFPPSTSLSLKLSMTSAPATADLTIERTLEAAGVNPTPALVLAAANWPEFAARNYLNIPIRVWDQFSDSQRSQILDWVYGLMVVLRRGADAGSLSANETSVWNRFFKSLSPADGSQKAWMPLLTAGTPPLAMQVLSYLYDPAHTGPKEKNLNPPQYMHTQESIRQYKEAAFPSLPPSTYHALLWSRFADLAATGGEEKTAGALGRFYGFGERLRWPKAPVGQDAEYYKHFMVVQPTDGNPAEPWFITNAHSLAGQVFRVGPVADSVQVTALNVTEFKVQGNSIIAGGAANPYQKHFLAPVPKV
jgi:hypothetical protein